MRNKTHEKGRPPKITPEVLQKIEYAYALGCTDKEVCLYADISLSCLYDYLKKNIDFKNRRDILKETQVLKARQKSAELIENGDATHIRWYLERRKKEEFSLTHNIDITGAATLSIDDKEKALHDLLINFKGSDSPSD